MAIEDILFEIYKDYRNERDNEIEKHRLAEDLIKKAYFGFYFDWTTLKKGHKHLFNRTDATDVLNKYSQIFSDIAIHIFDTKPESVDEISDFVIKLKELSKDFDVSPMHFRFHEKDAEKLVNLALDRARTGEHNNHS